MVDRASPLSTVRLPIKVMVVDDHPIVRDGLKNMLMAFDDLVLVEDAGNGNDALVCAKRSRPDVVLMDLYMPILDGIGAVSLLLEYDPGMKIIILTSLAEDEPVREALEAGAAGYLLKNMAIDDMAEAIRAVHAGKPVLSAEATSALIRAKTASKKLGHDLSPRELEALALIVEGKSNEEIAGELVISTATARHHVSACLQKLGAANRAQAAVLALKHQLID